MLESLLIKDPKIRLGSGKYGFQDVKDHAWFKTIDWEALYNKELTPPFKPKLSGATDTKYIDKEFTSQKPVDSAKNSSLLTAECKDHWKGFTYEDTKVCQ